MMTKNNFFKQFVVLLALIAAGAQGALAQTPDFTVNGVGYSSYSSSWSGGKKYASIMSYAGTAETLVIPDTVQNGSTKYRVANIGCSFTSSSGDDFPPFHSSNISSKTVTFSSVKTLTIQGSPYLYGTIELPDAETLVFEKTFSWDSGASPITCPKLTEIYFKGDVPTLSGSGSKYFANGRIGEITAYVAGKTAEEIEQMKATQAVWGEFKDVKPLAAPDEKVNIQVTNVVTPLGFVAPFSDDLGNTNTTEGTRTYQADKYQNYTFYVTNVLDPSNNLQMALPVGIYLNGKNILSKMKRTTQQTSGSTLVTLQYTLENVGADTYIHIITIDTRVKYDLTAEEGGKVKVGSGTASDGQQTFYLSKSSQVSQTLKIIPDAGYELGEYWLNGVKEAMVAGADGSCTKTVTGTGGGSILVTFKRKETIPFADDAVKQICVANWDADGDGELSFVEAQNVTELGDVFKNNSTIETFDELQYFTGLTEIGARAFSNCTNLKSITLPQTVTSMVGYTFAGCSSLESINLPQAITTIGGYTFAGCSSLESIELPNTLESINAYAFTVSGLKEIFIPANVQNIHTNAFRSCNNLKLIAIDEENPVYESGIYRNAIIEKETQKALRIINNPIIPEGVRNLVDNVWAIDGTVTQLVVPASVEEIGQYAFSSSLETLTVKWRVPITFNYRFFGSNASYLPTNCKLIVPFGTRDAYIAKGWTEDIFKGGVVEDDSVLDVNGDGAVDMKDASSVMNKYLD